MNDNSLTLALTEYEEKTINDIHAAAAAREALRWTQELDPASFQQFILQLAHISGRVFDWQEPVRKAGEDDRSYNLRIEASFMQLTGTTLANLIANSKGWIGVWAGLVLDHGLTLLPEFNADDNTADLALPLDNWFNYCNLRRHLSPDAYSRLRGYLLEVHPYLRMHSNRMDEIVKPLLLDEDAGFGVAKKVRTAIDAVRIARKKNEGRVPRELSQKLAESFEKGGKNPDELEAEMAEMGYTPRWVEKKHAPVQVGSWLYGSEETKDKRIEYLVVADSPDAIAFMESTFGRAPFVMHSDMGGDSDSRRRKYKDQLDQDQGKQD